MGHVMVGLKTKWRTSNLAWEITKGLKADSDVQIAQRQRRREADGRVIRLSSGEVTEG